MENDFRFPCLVLYISRGVCYRAPTAVNIDIWFGEGKLDSKLGVEGSIVERFAYQLRSTPSCRKMGTRTNFDAHIVM